MALIAHRVRTPRLAAGPAGFTNRSLVRAYCKSGRDPYASPMALLGKARTATGAGVIITVRRVLVCGNQAFTEWVVRHADGHTVWGWFLRILSWPAWAFGPTDSSSGAMRNLLAQDLRAILLVVFVALVLGISAKSATGGGAFVLGWASLIFGSALAAFLTTFIAAGTSWLDAFGAAAARSAYGLFVGWIVGAGVAAGRGGGWGEGARGGGGRGGGPAPPPRRLRSGA